MTPDRPRPVAKLPPDQRQRIERDGCGGEPPAGLLLGIEQLNAGEYWECHETLEEIWAREARDIRYLYQGILLVGVGLLHLGRRNHHGALTKLRSGVELLAAFEPSCLGVDVAGLRRDAGPILDLLIEGPHRLEDALGLPAPVCRLEPGRDARP